MKQTYEVPNYISAPNPSRLRALMLEIQQAYGATIRFQDPFVFGDKVYCFFSMDPGTAFKDTDLNQVFDNKQVKIDTRDLEMNGETQETFNEGADGG